MYLAVDIGTGSVRCALINDSGVMLQKRVENIKTWNPADDFYNQSTNDIWSKIVQCLESLKSSDFDNYAKVEGIAFDATCSLVIVDGENTVKKGLGSCLETIDQNVILWMDHRAKEQATRINSISGAELNTVGGVISPEMQTPKLLWLYSAFKNDGRHRNLVIFGDLRIIFGNKNRNLTPKVESPRQF